MKFFNRTSQQVSTGPDDGESDDGNFLNPESSLPSNRASDWSKERSFQQLELSDVHHNNSQTGCCRRLLQHVVKALHVVDISIGIALLVYGSLLCTQFQTTAMAAVVFCLTLGTIHMVTSSLGAFSFFARGCSRFGLRVSGYIGPYLALVYVTLLIALLFDEDGFVQYLDDHKEVMYLGTNVANNVKQLMPLVYSVLIVLGLLEASRCSAVLKIQESFLRHDAEESLIPQPLTEALLDRE